MCDYFLSVEIYFYMVSTNWVISFIKDIVDSTNLDCSQTRNFPRLNFQLEPDVTQNVYSLENNSPILIYREIPTPQS